MPLSSIADERETQTVSSFANLFLYILKINSSACGTWTHINSKLNLNEYASNQIWIQIQI